MNFFMSTERKTIHLFIRFHTKMIYGTLVIFYERFKVYCVPHLKHFIPFPLELKKVKCKTLYCLTLDL